MGGYTATITDTEVRNNALMGIVVANVGSRAILVAEQGPRALEEYVASLRESLDA